MRSKRARRLGGLVVSVGLACLLAGLSPRSAQAHLNLGPRLVEQGQVADLVVELPRLRAGAIPTTLELEGAGFEMLASRLREQAGGDSRWDVRARITANPGILDLVLRAGFPDGATVEVDDRLTVLPATPKEQFPWVAAIVGGGLGFVFVLLALGISRRHTRSTADRSPDIT